MLKYITLSIMIFLSYNSFSQDNCIITVNEKVTLDSLTNKYTPIIENANCEWKKYELNILNRWWMSIYTSKAINEEWDVSELTSGVYHYTLKATSMTKHIIEETGSINLVK